MNYVRSMDDWEAYRRLSPDDLNQFITFTNVSCATRPAVFARIPFRDGLASLEH